MRCVLLVVAGMDDDPNLRLDNLRPMNMDDWHRADLE